MIPYADMIVNIIRVVIGFTLLLLFHELGHLLAGFLVRVKVERLSIGFGPRLFGFTWKGTDYMLSAVPAGAYVKFKGDEPTSPESREPDSFWGKPPGPRAIIIIGGVAMNIITAVLAFVLAFKIGVKTESPVVGQVMPQSPAEAAGFLPGDRIISLDGRKVTDFMDVSYGVALSSSSEALSVAVEREERRVSLLVTPQYDEQLGFQSIGIIPAASLTVGDVLKDSPAKEAGLLPDDELIAVDGLELASWEEFEGIVHDSPGKTLNLAVRREGQIVETPVSIGSIYEWEIGAHGYPVVLDVREGWPADLAGVEPGDLVTALDGTQLAAEAMLKELLQKSGGEPVLLTLLRNGEVLELLAQPRHDAEDWLLGISYSVSTLLSQVEQDSPAAIAGLGPGDQIISLDGDGVESWPELAAALRKAQDKPVQIKWFRQGSVETAEIAARKAHVAPYGYVGIVPTVMSEWVRLGFGGACKLGLRQSINTARYAALTAVGLLTRRVSPSKAVGGPVYIGYVLYKMSRRGIGRLIYFFGMISVFISFANLLPLPVFDGGHLVILLVEKLKGSPVSTRAMQVWQYAGFVVVGCIFVLVIANDVRRLVFGPF